jgi:hypothetical protein
MHAAPIRPRNPPALFLSQFRCKSEESLAGDPLLHGLLLWFPTTPVSLRPFFSPSNFLSLWRTSWHLCLVPFCSTPTETTTTRAADAVQPPATPPRRSGTRLTTPFSPSTPPQRADHCPPIRQLRETRHHRRRPPPSRLSPENRRNPSPWWAPPPLLCRSFDLDRSTRNRSRTEMVSVDLGRRSSFDPMVQITDPAESFLANKIAPRGSPLFNPNSN